MDEPRDAAESEEEVNLRLRDFTPVVVRRPDPRDRTEIVAFVRRLTRESVELRFGSPVREAAVVDEVLGVRDPENRVALLLEAFGPLRRVVGSAEFVRYPRDRSRAEVAFLIEDDFQGRGAGTVLLHELARRARTRGIRKFTAFVMQENVAMSDVFVHSGFPYSVVRDGPQWLIELDIGRAAWRTPLAPESRLGPSVA